MNKNETDLRNLKLDGWQKKVLKAKGNIALRCGRQTGKSTITARKARDLANEYPGTTSLIIAPSQRQSGLLYEKIRAMFEQDNREKIEKELKNIKFRNLTEKRNAEKEASIFQEEPTKTRIRLKNGSDIICEPCGETGAKIRGFTVDFLIADEAQLIPRAVWIAVIPMMATSKKMRGTGWLIILGTPAGKTGFFYEVFQRKDFKQFHVSAEKCKRQSKKFLNKEKKRLTNAQYSQEYLAEFIESTQQYFSTELIKKCETLTKEELKKVQGNKYLGVDFARYGGDQNAFVEVIITKEKKVYVSWYKLSERESTIAPMAIIKQKDEENHYKKIFVDSGGLGGPILDVLQESISKRRVIGIDNSQRRYQEEGEEKKKGILKEDLYSNLLLLMEAEKIKWINDYNIRSSLKSISFRYSMETGKLKISGKGKGSHLTEALVRACWGIKNSGNDLFLY